MIQRALHYAKRHGLRAMFSRAWLGLKRMVSGDRMVLFFCDLDGRTLPVLSGAGDAQVERRQSEAGISPEELAAIGAWNPEAAQKLIRERLARGSTLWLFKQDGQVAGYGWTIIGNTIVPHYFPLGINDAHLFDFFVLPKYRGLGINPTLVRHILAQLSLEKRGRAFIEAAEWNAPQLLSLRKTPFQRFGCARKMTILGKTIVFWSN